MAVFLMSFAWDCCSIRRTDGLPAWLASAGVDLKSIGFYSLVSLPYTFKFFWAPFLDRYVPPLLGRRRGWIVIFQACLAVAIGVMGFSSPTAAPYYLAAVALLLVFLSASQDIVVDAYRVDIIPAHERRHVAALTTFGYRTALALTGKDAGAHRIPYQLARGFSDHRRDHGGNHAVDILGARALDAGSAAENPRQCGMESTQGSDQPNLRGISPAGLLYKPGDAFALSLYSAFMIKGVGFSLDELSIAGKANMTISTITGVTLGGWIYMRWGMFRSLLVFGIGQSLTNLMYTVLALSGKKLWLMALATTLDTGVGGMGQAACVDFSCPCATRTSAHAVRAALRHSDPSTRHHRRDCRHLGHCDWLAEIFCRNLPHGGPGSHSAGDLAPSIEELAARESADGDAEAAIAVDCRAAQSRVSQWRRELLSGASTGRSDWTTRYGRCRGTHGPGPRTRHRWRPTSLPAHPRPRSSRPTGVRSRIRNPFQQQCHRNMNLDGLILTIDGHHFKELVGTASVPFAYDRPDKIIGASSRCSAPFNSR